MEILSAYGKHKRVRFSTEGASLTHQSEMPGCEINTIMKKFEKTGVLEHRNTFEGKYGDFTGLPQDYHESMNAVIDARDMFLTLPATMRRRFGNDPGAFLEFVADPDNLPEMEKMGLSKPDPNADPPVIEDPPKNPPAQPKVEAKPPDVDPPTKSGT